MKRWTWMVLVMAFFFGSVAEAAQYTIEVSRKWYGKPYVKIVAMNGKTVAHGESLENFTDAMATALNIANGDFEVLDRFHS